MSKRAEVEQQCRAKGCTLAEELSLLRDRCRKLEELSYVDALTGLYNFRYLQKALEMEMERTRRTKLPTSLIMVDLDHFKNINTLYGHECGNTALASIGKILQESVRVIDIPCRYGGEEFALILPGAMLRQSVRIAERLLETIRTTPLVLKDEVVTITASFGVAVFRSGDELTAGRFLSKADSFLYQAKDSGRNQVCSEDFCVIPPSDEVTPEEKTGLFAPLQEGE
ncbi:MAG: GGDEF domain-containing protein [Syntrophobacteraceae bacterium]